MKSLLSLTILIIGLSSSITSYAWVCTYRGPLGAIYTQNGHGQGYQAARDYAKAACLAGKAHNAGPCRFVGCRRGY